MLGDDLLRSRSILCRKMCKICTGSVMANSGTRPGRTSLDACKTNSGFKTTHHWTAAAAKTAHVSNSAAEQSSAICNTLGSTKGTIMRDLHSWNSVASV